MIKFQLKPLHAKAIEPTRGTPLSLGLDLYALAVREDGNDSRIILPPRTTRAIPTGWAICPPQPTSFATAVNGVLVDPPNTVWLPAVCSRSGLAKRSIFVANAPGIIDPDYRGEIQVLLYNGGVETYYIEHGDRIAQLIAIQASLSTVELVLDLDKTERGEGGCGSTGR